MNSQGSINIDDNIRPYLNEIAERLWASPSHAAIMVGSGFSKNANINFPDWNKLGDIFFEKIHGRAPNKENGECKYLNVLKLADEVQAAYGRPTLNQLLRSNIPDNDSEPSQLHIKLLRLPWSDVFTTNYDTLLERASTYVTNQRFDIVVNKDDLVYSEKPRIIKLHGSFPSERPFIITEEDYRVYPKEFAPFVNTVQQSLLENTLCLVGFSGDDPNFLQWIGWIRDNLGRNKSPKIYLVGIFNLTEAQKKLLEQRDIILINLSNSLKGNVNHYKALELFFDYLISRKSQENYLDWPLVRSANSPHQLKDKNKEQCLETIVREWKDQRLSYPGWVVLPKNKRGSLWHDTDWWLDFISSSENVKYPYNIIFTFELCWRFERCLAPFTLNFSELVKTVIDKHLLSFSPNDNNEKTNISIGNNNKLESNEIHEMCVYLALALLRFYREEGMLENWDILIKKFDIIENNLSHVDKAKLYYERTLYYLFKLDINMVKNLLNNWPTNFSIPFWEAKKAGILAEIGEIDEAETILEQSLQEIRTKLNLKPVRTDYTLVSQESSVMLLIRIVNSVSKSRKNINNLLDIITDPEGFSERWDTLKKFKCDPWDEISFFSTNFKHPYIPKKYIEEKNTFDGTITVTRHSGSWDGQIFCAQNFLRAFEDFGFPFNISNHSIIDSQSVSGAIERLANNSPYWSLATLIRCGDIKGVDTLFNRQAIIGRNVQYIDDLVDNFINAISLSETEISKGDLSFHTNFGTRLSHIVPEILSRLCSICSPEKKDFILSFIIRLYGNKHLNKFKGMNFLLARLLNTYTQEDIYLMIPRLLEIKCPENIDMVWQNDFPNPFVYVKVNKNNISSANNNDIKPNIIASLLNDLKLKGYKRKWAINTLVKLFDLNLLNKKQTNDFGNRLWADVDENGFPTPSNFYYSNYINLPHPKSINPSGLLKEYINKNKFPIQTDQKNESISFSGGSIRVCGELVHSSKLLNWSQNELFELLTRLIDWWKKDKKHIESTKFSRDPFSISDEFRKRFINILDILKEVILPAIQPNNNNILLVQKLVNDLKEYRYPVVEIKTIRPEIFNTKPKELQELISNSFRSTETQDVIDGLNALQVVARQQNEKLYDKSLLLLGQKISWNNKVALLNCLDMACYLIREHPKKISQEFILMCIEGLKSLLTTTALTSELSAEEFSQNYNLRKVAARLAYLISSIFFSVETVDRPETLGLWQNICFSDNEFYEIRKQWSR